MVRRVSERQQRVNSQCAANVQNIQLGLMQTPDHKVSPANTPERTTKTGMRHPRSIFLASESSSCLAYVWRPWLTLVMGAGVAGKIRVAEGRKSHGMALLLTKRRSRLVEIVMTIRMRERIGSQQPVVGSGPSRRPLRGARVKCWGRIST